MTVDDFVLADGREKRTQIFEEIEHPTPAENEQ